METHTMTFRGKNYTADRIESASKRMGYLVWPKITDPRCYGDRNLGALLEGSEEMRKNGEYERNVLAMRSKILSAIDGLKRRGINRVRLGASWAEADTPGGWEWMKWYIRAFHEAGFDILPCLNYTPHRHAAARIEKIMREAKHDPERFALVSHWKPSTNTPPEPIDAFAAFVERFAREIGPFVGTHIQLWNEQNLITDWDYEIDTTGQLFADMLRPAADAVRAHGRKVLLGGLTKYNESIDWMKSTCPHGILEHVDAIGLHGNRGTWSDKKVLPPWSERIREFKELMAGYTDKDLPVIIDEAGFTTIDLELAMSQAELEKIQVAIFADLMLVLADGNADGVYWYTDNDLITPSVRFLTTGWEDVLQYFFGDTDIEGNPKLLRVLLEKGGPLHVLEYAESYNLWDLKDTIIDRGDPASWPAPKLKTVIAEMTRRAQETTARGKFKEAA